jgi:transcriptional regulator with XRE-family HTH domain
MDEIMNQIERKRTEKGYSKRKFSRICGFGINTYLSYTKGITPSLAHMDRMLKELGLTYTLGKEDHE